MSENVRIGRYNVCNCTIMVVAGHVVTDRVGERNGLSIDNGSSIDTETLALGFAASLVTMWW